MDDQAANVSEHGFKNAPIELIAVTERDDGDKFEVREEGLAYLNSLRGDVAVVASCGRLKSGKTTLLNYILSKIENDGVSKLVNYLILRYVQLSNCF